MPSCCRAFGAKRAKVMSASKYEFKFTHDGRMPRHVLGLIEQFVRQSPVNVPISVTLKIWKPRKTSQQVRYWRGVVIPTFCEWVGEPDADDMHDTLMHKLWPEGCTVKDDGFGGKRLKRASLADMTIDEVAKLIDRAVAFGAQQGIAVPPPS